jgi:hypothetical protein
MFKSTKLSDDKPAALEAEVTHAQAFLDQALRRTGMPASTLESP